MLILLEGIALCFILLIICVVGIANGPVGCVYFYEPAVQEKVVKLGLTSKEKIERSRKAVRIAIFAPVLILVPGMVYFVNGARGSGIFLYRSQQSYGLKGCLTVSLSIGIGWAKQKHGSFPVRKIVCRIFQRRHW